MFNSANYEELIRFAEEKGFVLRSFRDLDSAKQSGLVILLRHDVDLSLEAALLMAKLEKSLGIKATYFFLLYNNYYNPLSPNGRRIIKEIDSLGHEVGLHWYYPDYVGNGWQKKFKTSLYLLEDITGKRVLTASQHDPSLTKKFDVSKLIQNEPSKNS